MKTFNESDHAEAIQAADEAGIDTVLVSLDTDLAPFHVITTKFFKEWHSHKPNPPVPQWGRLDFTTFEAAQECVSHILLDSVVKKANLNGIESIREACFEDIGPFYVLITEYHRDPKDPFLVHPGTTITSVAQDNDKDEIKFGGISFAKNLDKYYGISA